MKKNLLAAAFLLCIIAIYVPSCKYKSSGKANNSDETYCDTFIQRIKSLQKNAEAIRDTDRMEFRFDFEAYLKEFDQLSPEKGWIVEGFYLGDGYGASPEFYARKITDDKDSLEKYFLADGIWDYHKSIRTSDHLESTNTLKGYYQLIIFELIGNNFNRYWHSRYANIDIIVSRNDLSEILNRKDHFHRFDSLLVKRIDSLSVKPLIREYDDSVTYSLLIFNAWEGFRRKTYSVGRNFPHFIHTIKDSLEVDYNCRIHF